MAAAKQQVQKISMVVIGDTGVGEYSIVGRDYTEESLQCCCSHDIYTLSYLSLPVPYYAVREELLVAPVRRPQVGPQAVGLCCCGTAPA